MKGETHVFFLAKLFFRILLLLKRRQCTGLEFFFYRGYYLVCNMWLGLTRVRVVLPFWLAVNNAGVEPRTHIPHHLVSE